MAMFKGVISGLTVSPHDPVYEIGLRRIKWASTATGRKKYHLFVIALLHAIIIGLWLGLHDFLIDTFNLIDGAELAAWVFVVALVGGVLLNLFLDFGSLLFAINSINGEHLSGRWDLLRLSLLTEDQLVDAKYALAQIRAWRVLVFIRGIRIVALVVFFLLLFVLPFAQGEGEGFWVSTADFFVDSPYDGLLTLIILTSFWFFYLFDPVWRLRALTALGIAVSSRTRSIVFALLAAFGTMLCVWILQGLMTGFFVWLIFLMLRDTNIDSAAVGLSILLMLELIMVGGTYLFYRLLRDYSLNKALLWAFRE